MIDADGSRITSNVTTHAGCTCAGTSYGYPQHESFCGQDDTADEKALDALYERATARWNDDTTGADVICRPIGWFAAGPSYCREPIARCTPTEFCDNHQMLVDFHEVNRHNRAVAAAAKSAV